MPLDTYAPVIDNRTFDDVVTEARARIARYTPEWAAVWTDVNDSDPGITLVQLFAWMTEMMIYRLGKVPDQNYLKFLELMGIQLMPARAAHVEITFPMDSNPGPSVIIVPQHTQVTAEDPHGGPPIVFETDEALYAIKPTLDQVLAYDGFAYENRTSENTQHVSGFKPFGNNAAAGAALYLGFNSSVPFPEVTLDLAVWVQETTGGTIMSDCNLPVSKVYPPVDLSWQFWSGDWFALGLMKDDTAGFQRSGHVSVKYAKTPSVEMTPGTFGGVGPLYWIRALIRSGGYVKAPVLLAIRTNTAPATQAQTVRQEVVGGSSGMPNQVFTLANQPVLEGTLQLQVDQGDGFQDWTLVSDFSGSDANALVYVLDRTTGSIRFGDGKNGAIPVANVESPNDNIVAATYRYGGGQQGNVDKEKITTLGTSIPGIDDQNVSNLFAAYGGQNEEALPDAKLRAPRTLKSRCRAVTQDDFTTLATQVGGVKRAFALPLVNPSYAGVDVAGAVTIIVVPDADPTLPNPMPSDGLLRSVCAYLNLRCLITTELYVIGPKYQLVSVKADLIALSSSDLARVKSDAEQSLTDFFHPLRGGIDGLGWPLGGPVFYSRVYQRVLGVPGVDRISSLTISLDGVEYPACTDIPIQPTSLLYSTGHNVTPQYSFSR